MSDFRFTPAGYDSAVQPSQLSPVATSGDFNDLTGVPTLSYTDESVGRRVFTWDTVNDRWQMTYGDTGERNIALQLENGATAHYARIRRVNHTVWFHFAFNSVPAGSGSVVYNFPAGFRISGQWMAFPQFAANNSGTVANAILNPNNGDMTIGTTGGNLLTGTFITRNAWPTSLPGDFVVDIPQ